MRQLACGEHHLHDEMCYTDHEQIKRDVAQWCRERCTRGDWPMPHKPIELKPEWHFCPLCGREIS